jgi:hypothetical protein
MANLTLTDLLTEFYQRGFAYLNDSSTGIARATRWLNQGQRDLCMEDDWPFLLVTTTSTSPIALTDIREVLFVGDATRELEEADREELSPGDPLLTRTGSANAYWRDGSTIRAYPADTTTWTVRYLRMAPDMVNPTDEPVVPNEWRLLIVEYAVIWALRDRSNFQEAEALRQALVPEVARMQDALMDLPDRQLQT